LYSNNKPTKFDKLAKLIPIIINTIQLATSIADIIMPRRTQESEIISRGGGGSGLYHNVNSRLLPDNMRRNALIGGHNDVSKETQNHGRVSTPKTEDSSGANLQGHPDVHGPYRPSNQTNNYKGMISIPAPAAHVYVRFENGDANRPIVIDTFAAQADYQNIYGVHPK